MPEENKTRVCPLCRKGILETRLVNKVFPFGSEEGEIKVEAKKVPVEVCTGCGENFFGPEAARLEHQAICQTLGLLMPKEITAIREKLGLSLDEFARLTGIGVEIVKQWEKGRLVHARAMDRYLRLLGKAPENAKILAQFAATGKLVETAKD